VTFFKELGLPSAVLKALEGMGVVEPTPVQIQAIPGSVCDKDLLVSSQTGSGKTIAYLLPAIMRVVQNPKDHVLILVPTRELAIQVNNRLSILLGKPPLFSSALLIGGEYIEKQFIQLRRKPSIVIGTPGRVNDHLQRKTLNLSFTNRVVLDEMDRMLDMGFSDQINAIYEFLPKEELRTWMYSATVLPAVERMSQKYMTDPLRICIDSVTKPNAQVQQDMIQVQESDKFDRLLTELDQREGSVIVFVKTKRSAEELSHKLKMSNHQVDAIHGDLQHRRRERVIQDFRRQKHRIIVATDIAARGLDVHHIRHVVNYDLPMCAEDYIHRIGRTGRGGGTGFALSMVSPQDSRNWKKICYLINGKPEPSDRRGGRDFDRKGHSSNRRDYTSDRRDGRGFETRNHSFERRDHSSERRNDRDFGKREYSSPEPRRKHFNKGFRKTS